MRQALLSVDGVVAADVSYERKRAEVRYDPTRATPGALIAAVDGAGFDAVALDGSEQQAP